MTLMVNKRKLITYLGFSLFSGFLLFSLYVLIRMARLEQVIIDSIALYGYAGILLFSFLSDLVMQPIGPEVPLVSGIITGLNPFVCLLFAVVGSIAATVAGYHLGKIYGEKGIMKHYGYARYSRWKGKYDKYGRTMLVVAAVTPVPYVPMCWLSGVFGMPIREFLAFSVIPRALRLFGIVLITLKIIHLGA